MGLFRFVMGLLYLIQSDSLARGPKFFKRQNYLKKPLATQTIFSIDYEQALLCIVSGMCI
jgi:hypothetical protein